MKLFSASLYLRSYSKLGMPALSPTMTSGRIAQWKKKEGERFKVDDVLCEVETDKATVDFTAVDDGILAKIIVQNKDKEVKVGETVALVVGNESEIPEAIEAFNKSLFTSPGKTESQAKTSATLLSNKQPSVDTSSESKKGLLTPSARSILGENSDLSQITGTGKKGRIMKQDALNYLKNSTSTTPANQQ